MIKKIPMALCAILWFCAFPHALFAQQHSMQLLFEIDQAARLGGETYGTALYAEPGAGQPALVCLTRNELFSVATDGKIQSVKKLEKHQRASLSADGSYFSVMSYESEFISLIEVYSTDGKPRFQVKPDRRSAYINFLIGPKARYAVGVELVGPPEGTSVTYAYHFFDMTGRETGSFKETLPREALPLSSGRTFMLHDAKSGLLAYDAKGISAWKVKGPFRSIRSSGDSDWLMASGVKDRKSVNFFLNDKPAGNARLNDPVRNMEVSPSGDRSVATGARDITAFTLSEKAGAAPAWKYAFDNKKYFINSTALLDNGLLACGMLQDNGAALSPDKRFTKAVVVLFDADGKPAWEESYAVAASNAWIPVVDMSSTADALFLSVRTREKLYLYRMEY